MTFICFPPKQTVSSGMAKPWSFFLVPSAPRKMLDYIVDTEYMVSDWLDPNFNTKIFSFFLVTKSLLSIEQLNYCIMSGLLGSCQISQVPGSQVLLLLSSVLWETGIEIYNSQPSKLLGNFYCSTLLYYHIPLFTQESTVAFLYLFLVFLRMSLRHWH